MIETINVDVAIVGAGPAGSAAALSCHKHGLSVALIDKAVFPRDKVCGDGIPLKTFKLLEELGFNEQDLFKDGFKINRLKVYGPDHHVTTYGGLTPDASTKSGCIPRKAFDNALYRRAAAICRYNLTGYKLEAIENGANIQTLRVRSLKTKSEQTVVARAVIAADGANSYTARLLKLLKRDQAHHFDGLRWYFKGKRFDSSVHLFYDKRTLPGYVWVFPVARDMANVGIMINKKHKKNTGATIRDIFIDVLESNPRLKAVLNGAEPLDEIKGAPLPLGTLPGSRITDGVVLVGDAAAFINPVTGGGIYFAILSAMKAADILAELLGKNVPVSKQNLQQYEHWWRQTIFPGFFYSDRLKKKLDSERFARLFFWLSSRFKPVANYFIMVYGRPLPKGALRHPFFWLRVLMGK
ncbi:MAG: NAD(P)/FAD-dependent oxidoreductase [Calditrichaeota bacterium]|nr:MAG: NAD(P)/FAD-dependent oxidoreductase [Calditrichota bacterium]